MNRTLYLLWFSDVVLLTGFGLVSPILSIFISQDIVGGSIIAAGIASAVFLTVKAAIQIPFSRYVDSHKYKVLWLHIGTLFIATVPFQYYFAHTIKAIYVAQIFYGIGAGLAAPAWLSIWSKHLDKDHEGFEWSLYSSTIGLGTAFSAFVGATLATFIGFRNTMILMGILAILGALILIGLKYDVDETDPMNITAKDKPKIKNPINKNHHSKYHKYHNK